MALFEPKESPALANAIGCDIITSDGSTLLGTDDKAGIADIMQALVELISNPDIPATRCMGRLYSRRGDREGHSQIPV